MSVQGYGDFVTVNHISKSEAKGTWGKPHTMVTIAEGAVKHFTVENDRGGVGTYFALEMSNKAAKDLYKALSQVFGASSDE